jgi:hypothetical protein
MTTYLGESFAITYPSGWCKDEGDEDLTLSPAGFPGAITVSTYRHRARNFRVDALKQCEAFVTQKGAGQKTAAPTPGGGAEASFTDESGRLWIVRTVAVKNWFALATYNSDREDELVESQAREILASLQHRTRQETTHGDKWPVLE